MPPPPMRGRVKDTHRLSNLITEFYSKIKLLRYWLRHPNKQRVMARLMRMVKVMMKSLRSHYCSFTITFIISSAVNSHEFEAGHFDRIVYFISLRVCLFILWTLSFHFSLARDAQGVLREKDSVRWRGGPHR